MEHATVGFEPLSVTIFTITLTASLLLDLFIHRKDQIIGFKSALFWSFFWVVISLGFGIYLLERFDSEVATLFFTGYILEKSLSVDNLFVIMAVFAWFKIPDQLKHRILYYGILGALVFRAVFVALGSSLISLGNWVEIVFGLWVFSTAVMMVRNNDNDNEEIEDYSHHIAYRFTRWLFPVWPKFCGHNFFISGKKVAEIENAPENSAIKLKRRGPVFCTPLLLCLAVVEISDITFAFDSVPAVIAVSKDPFIIYTSIMFAVLGLRSMYFILEVMRKYLCRLEIAVICLLVFIAFKLCYNAVLEIMQKPEYSIGNTASLITILSFLSAGILGSVIFPKNNQNERKE